MIISLVIAIIIIGVSVENSAAFFKNTIYVTQLK